MYVLTAKHNLVNTKRFSVIAQRVSASGNDADELQVIGQPFFHPDNEIDAAIIKVKPISFELDYLSVLEDPFLVNGPLTLAGHPHVRRKDEFSFRTNSIIVQNRRPGGYIEGKLEDNATYDEVVGQSGGGIFLQYGGNLFLAGIQSRMAAGENEQLGRIVFMPLSFFEEILKGNPDELSTLHFSIKPYTNDPAVNFKYIQATQLHEVTKECITEQIKSVGMEKYIPEIYTSREAESEVKQFVEFGKHFLILCNNTLLKLEKAAGKMLHSTAKEAVYELRAAINAGDAAVYRNKLKRVKEGFYFEKVEELLDEIDYIILKATDAELRVRIAKLVNSLYAQPFIANSLNGITGNIIVELLAECRRRQESGGSGKKNSNYYELIKIFPHFLSATAINEEMAIQLTNLLILELRLLIEVEEKKCIALVDKAGAGKTNIACHTASQLISHHPVLLLSGQMTISTEFGIVQHIQTILESKINTVFSDWINRVDEGLKKNKQWFFIIIDGINENDNPVRFAQALKELLAKLEFKRIKLILTCRDILWESFSKSLNGFLYSEIIPINRYTDKEWKKAIGRYFKKYKVTCVPNAAAVHALKDPLLLRFFCEANQGKSLGHIADIKLAEIFNRYINRINESIGKKINLPSDTVVLQYLLGIAGEMWNARSVNISNDRIAGLGSYSKEFSDRLMQMIVAENIILKREVRQYSIRQSIRFLYDEFMEYMLARYLFDQIDHSAEPHRCLTEIIGQTAKSIDSFPAVLGAIFFLDQMLEKKEALVNRFVKLAFKPSETSHQLQFIYALNHIDPKAIDEEQIVLIERFYNGIDLTYKEQLSQAILKILPAIPNHPFARKFLREVLEVDVVIDDLLNFGKKASYNPGKLLKVDREFWLPPARFHFSNNMRLNAMAILVKNMDEQNVNIIQSSINRIGLSDMDSALGMMKLLECLDNERLFKVLESFSGINLPEYKIFSAWLVRNRYGDNEAILLARLLTDYTTRVYEYVFKLFDERQIESCLLELLLRKYAEVANWHLQNMICIFSKTNQFIQDDKTGFIKKEIADALKDLQKHKSRIIRYNAFIACLQYPEYFNSSDLKNKMLLDTDPHIREHGSLL